MCLSGATHSGGWTAHLICSWDLMVVGGIGKGGQRKEGQDCRACFNFYWSNRGPAPPPPSRPAPPGSKVVGESGWFDACDCRQSIEEVTMINVSDTEHHHISHFCLQFYKAVVTPTY